MEIATPPPTIGTIAAVHVLLGQRLVQLDRGQGQRDRDEQDESRLAEESG